MRLAYPANSRRYNAYNVVVPTQHIITLVISLALYAHTKSPPTPFDSLRIIVFTFSFIFKLGGAIELVFVGNLFFPKYLLNYQNMLHICLKIGANSTFKDTFKISTVFLPGGGGGRLLVNCVPIHEQGPQNLP